MRIGIDQHTEQRTVSGCRVAFDTRTTAEANATRSPNSRKPPKRTKGPKGFVSA
jgi:hypothetical protein